MLILVNHKIEHHTHFNTNGII